MFIQRKHIFKDNMKRLLLICALFPLSGLMGQTKFEIHDKEPDYSTYKYIDECLAASVRVATVAQRNSIEFADSLNLGDTRLTKTLPAEVIQQTSTCLKNFDLDTIPYRLVKDFSKILLVANRDDDVDRMFKRVARTVSPDSAEELAISLMYSYMLASPARLDKVKELYEMAVINIHPDSIVKSLFLRQTVATLLYRAGDIQKGLQIANEILEITDTLSPKYRTPQLKGLIDGGLYHTYSNLLVTPESRDSLKVSSEAYNKYFAKVYKRLSGAEPQQYFDVYGIEVPDPVGHFWYSNENPGGEIRKIEPVKLIEKGRVTIIYFVQGGCHRDTRPGAREGRSNGRSGDCWSEIYRLRRIMSEYPDIRLVLVSSTYGSFGDAPPLQAKEEADTLADYFLNFHRLRGIHVIYNSEFIRLPKYDDRKVDLDTENQLNYSFGRYNLAAPNTVLMIDEEGQIFHSGPISIESKNISDERLRIVHERILRKQSK